MKFGYFKESNEKNNVFSFLDAHLDKIPNQEILKWVNPQDLLIWLKNPKEILPHQSITVKKLHELIGRIAFGYLEMGINKGDRIIVFVPMSLPLYASMFALQKIGAIPVFLDSWARRDQLGISAKFVSPKAIIAPERALTYLKDVPEINDIKIKISVGPTQNAYSAKLEDLMQSKGIGPTAPVEMEETALITFTTGSSGVPKGANRTHRFLAAQHYALHRVIPYQINDNDLPVFPIFSLNNIAEGVPTVIPAFDVGVPNDNDSLVILGQIKSCGISCITLSPSLLNNLSSYCLKNKITIPELRRTVTGGAPISRDNLVDFTAIAPKSEVWVLYGSTEVEPMAHIEAQEMIHSKSKSQIDPELVDEGVNVGQMDEGLEFRFLQVNLGVVTINQKSDWNNCLVKNGEVGELIVCGEHVCRDYYNNPEAFKTSKILDENKKVWHRTGDLARIDSNNNLWIVGRNHNAIKRGNNWIFPVMAEIVLKKLPFVKYCAYLGMPDKVLGQKTVCVIAPHQIDNNKSDEFKKEITRIMSKNNLPVDQILIRETIPMDPRHHSKVEYAVLREQILNELK